MRIHIYDVDNTLIAKYCNCITLLEEDFTFEMECLRTKLHNLIYQSLGLNKACVTRDERLFSIALAATVSEFQRYTHA